MAECIACKSDYTPGEVCSRCKTDNTAWEQWRQDHRGISGFSEFMMPGLFLPCAFTFLAPLVGVVGISVLWLTKGVAWPWSVPMLAGLTFLCALVILMVFRNRYQLREAELLNRVRGGLTTLLSARIRMVGSVALVATGILAWTTLTLSQPVSPEQTRFEHLLSRIETHGLASRPTRQAVIDTLIAGGPLSILAVAYPSAVLAAVYSSSLALALAHANRMNQEVPLPIFLSPTRLITLVQSEAEQSFDSMGPDLVWEGVERTKKGGIKLTARCPQDRKILVDLAGKKTDLALHKQYEVVADRWGRIVSITAGSELLT